MQMIGERVAAEGQGGNNGRTVLATPPDLGPSGPQWRGRVGERRSRPLLYQRACCASWQPS
jgi:hypothetical protein